MYVYAYERHKFAPVVPHKAMGSFKNRTPIGEVGCCEWDGRVNPLMDGKVVGVVFFGEWLWLQWSSLDVVVVWCSAAVAVVVVQWRCSCVV